MIRDLPGLIERDFDVLVVGGGIYGLTIAYDAAQRGLSVALVERGDFGAATSFNHLKTLHGGLRYLQTADVARMRESIHERRAFARIAPRFVRPLAFAMPTGPSLTRNPLAWKVALAIDGIVGRRRNEGIDGDHQLPPGRIVAGSACREMFDGTLRTVASAAVWHDYQTVDGDRLTLSFAKAAAAHGARLANYVEAVGLLPGGRDMTGVTARDIFTGGTFEVRARVVVIAAGPWTDQLAGRSASSASRLQLKAMNLVTSRPARPTALVAPTRAGRALVLLPWNGRTLVGTSESPDEHAADDQGASRREVTAFLDEINETFPMLALKADEIALVHRGIVPAQRVNGRLTLLSQSRIIDHDRSGGTARMISVIGVKYTTARRVAERVVDLVLRKLGRRVVTCRTAETLLPDAGQADSSPVDPIANAVREEMAHTLVDVVVRRTGLGAAGYPGDDASRRVAAAMGRLLGWSDDKMTEELTSLRRFYTVTD